MKKIKWPYRNKQIFMIPNRFGFAAVTLFILFTLVAATYSNNLLFLLAFLHVSFLLVAILQTARNLRYIEILSVQISSGFPGEQVPVKILIANKGRAPKLGLTLRCDEDQFLIDELTEKDQKVIQLSLKLPERRGQHILNRLSLSTDSPYGLFYGWLYFKVQTPYFVYPQARGETLPQLSHQQGAGDFSGLHEYQIGDSIQRISWKHSAKNEKWLVKEFKESANPQCLLRWTDCQQTDDEEKLSQLARWIVDCEKAKYSYKIQISQQADSAPFDQGESYFHRNMLELARWEKKI